MSSSRTSASAGRLIGIKAIQRILKDHDIFVARSTINTWRRRNPPSLKPPVDLEIVRGRPVLTASRKDLEAWIERAGRKHLFQRSQKNHATRVRRRTLVQKVVAMNGGSKPTS